MKATSPDKVLFSTEERQSSSNDNPLSQKDSVTFADLNPLIEISHGDHYVPSLPMNVVMEEEHMDDTERRIFIFERGGQFDLLMENPETFMWVSPLPEILLSRYGLVQRRVSGAEQKYKDLLIFPKEHKLTALEQSFVDQVIAVQQEVSAKTYH